MTLTDLTTIEHLERCLDGSETCTYELPGTTDERSSWIQTTLVQFRYTSLGTSDRGVVVRSLLKVSGSSRHQLTRLIRQYVTPGRCTRRQRTTRGFSRRSTQADVLLLAELDRLHDTPCGAVIKKECERALAQGDDRCERLAAISVSHIDTLRTSTTDQRQRRQFTTPHSKPAPIGERRRASRGSLRVDRVHQGSRCHNDQGASTEADSGTVGCSRRNACGGANTSVSIKTAQVGGLQEGAGHATN